MATLADSLISSSSRPVQLRMRPDLTARRHRYHGRTYWVVKEPVGLNYFRFHEEEYAILGMLDGQSSLDQIKEQFEAEFPPQKITFQDLQQFIGMLHRSGLVVAESSGQGRQLKRRRDEKKRRELLGKLSNVFALRFRGIDPEWLLNWLYPFTGWFFRRFAVLLFLMFGLSALLLVMVQFDVFRSRLPTFHEFFGARNWFYLAITMGIVKVLHEFGHGLSCKHFGGECHEMGAMLLVFTPALYCNVSDSWMLPNKWHRAAIGAAGMYVEVVLASIATYIWWFSDPATLVNQLALSVMFICSVSTIMFNGNPLLRFDGYYILMDLSEIPNLRQKSTEVLKRFLTHLCLGIEQPENPFLPQGNRFLFGLYTVAAVGYRWVVVFSILIFLNQVLEPYGLKVIGRLIGAMGFFGLVVQPLWQLGKFFYTPGRIHKVKSKNVAATLAVLAGVVLCVAYVPLPYYVNCQMTLEPSAAQKLYARTDSRLVAAPVQAGAEVKAGEVVAVLDSIELRNRVVQLRGEWRDAEKRRENLRNQMFDNSAAGDQAAEVAQEVEMRGRELQKLEQELELLTVRAPVDGTVIAAPQRPSRPGPNGRVVTWSGHPLQPKNIDARLVRDDIICLVGDPTQMEVVLVIDQADVQLVKPGDQVEYRLDAYPSKIFVGTIDRIANQEMKDVKANIASQAGGQVGTVTDAQGRAKPISTSFQAKVQLTEFDPAMRFGMRGKAHVYTTWQPLGTRLYRLLAKTFHFDL